MKVEGVVLHGLGSHRVKLLHTLCQLAVKIQAQGGVQAGQRGIVADTPQAAQQSSETAVKL